MPYARALRRKIDEDLLARMASGAKFPVVPIKRQRPARPASSYRAARREALKTDRRKAKRLMLYEIPEGPVAKFWPQVKESARRRARSA